MNWKRLILPLLILLLIFGIVCKVADILQGSEQVRGVIVDTWSKPLQESGYHPARHQKPDHIPADKEPPAGEPILHGTGTVELSGNPGELEVELIGVEAPDGSRWLTGWVKDRDGIERQIVFDRLDWREPAHDDRSDFSLIASCAWVNDSPDMGLGLAWQPVNALGIDGGFAVSADLNERVTDSPDWCALTIRGSRDVGVFSLGAGVGYRFGEDSGLHLEGSAGLAVGL